MHYQVNHYINGETVSTSGRKQPIFNPATGEVIADVLMADQALIDKAVDAAKKAFITWSSVPSLQRARIIFKFKTLLEKHMDELAELVTREHGKTLSDARGSVQRGIDVVDFSCHIPNHLKGSYTEELATEIDSYSIRQPLGVCAGITPFNFPAMIPLWMFPLAIACGNTFVLKPSEKDPSCAIRLAQLATEAGVPAGVINVVQGDKEAVDALLAHPDIKAISFVGSSAVAEYIHKTGITNGKRVQAFGGAKNHCVVMPDADLDQTAKAIVGAAYGSAGERCMAISVVIAIGDTVADELIKRIKPQVEKLKIGPGTSPTAEMGPLVTQAHWERVKSYIDLGIKEGAKLVVDGRSYKDTNGKGFYMGGCLFDNVLPNMKIYQEEIFGPVLSIVRVPNLETALKLINEHPYGNGTAIFTRDGSAARLFANKVQVGMVGVNIPIPVPVAHNSFGGWKHSMFGDIGMYGPEGIQFYTKLKTIMQRWPKDLIMDSSFVMPTH